jgi:predicted  nucleic acid-binding Zn-ribbon protein
MSNTNEALQRLHRVHRQRADLKDRLERGPRQVRAAETNASRLETLLAEAKEALKKTKVATDDKELQLKEREAHCEDRKRKLLRCESNREYQALQDEIAADEQANSVLSDEILDAFDKIEREEKKVDETRKQHEEAAAELEKIRQRVAAEQGNLESELARVEQELVQAEKGLPTDFKDHYERIVGVHGEDSLATAEDEICQGCYQTITPQMYDQLLCGKPILCKTCGRLLYLPAETRVGG